MLHQAKTWKCGCASAASVSVSKYLWVLMKSYLDFHRAQLHFSYPCGVCWSLVFPIDKMILLLTTPTGQTSKVVVSSLATRHPVSSSIMEGKTSSSSNISVSVLQFAAIFFGAVGVLGCSDVFAQPNSFSSGPAFALLEHSFKRNALCW